MNKAYDGVEIPLQGVTKAISFGGGFFTHGSELLRAFEGAYSHVVIMVDEEWEGTPGKVAIKEKLEEHLVARGWSPEDSLGLVVTPEIDAWLWSDSPHVAPAMGWSSWSSLEDALVDEGLLERGIIKPIRPKEAAEWALAEKCKPRTSAIYRTIASKVSLGRCSDPAFLELKAALARWFPAPGVE